MFLLEHYFFLPRALHVLSITITITITIHVIHVLRIKFLKKKMQSKI